jgi:hypothetical protein
MAAWPRSKSNSRDPTTPQGGPALRHSQSAGAAWDPATNRKRGTLTREVKTPGPDHSITIERNPHRVVVRVAGAVVADTTSALTLREAGYPPVEYIPPWQTSTRHG